MNSKADIDFRKIVRKLKRVSSSWVLLSKNKVPTHKRKLVPYTIRLRKYKEIVVPAVQRYQKWLAREVARREKKVRFK